MSICKPWHLESEQIQGLESEQPKLHGLVSSTDTVQEKDHAQGDQPNYKF